MKAFYKEDIITDYKPLDFESEEPFIIITEEEYQNAITSNEIMVNLNGKMQPYSALLQYYKKYKEGEIIAQHHQVNLKPAIHSAYLVIDNVKSDIIVDFAFKVMETGASVVNPCIILLATIILQDNNFATEFNYSAKKVVNNVITDENIVICLDKNLALSILGHLAQRTDNLSKILANYLQQLNDCKTIEEVKSINPIFNY